MTENCSEKRRNPQSHKSNRRYKMWDSLSKRYENYLLGGREMKRKTRSHIMSRSLHANTLRRRLAVIVQSAFSMYVDRLTTTEKNRYLFFNIFNDFFN